MRAAPIVCPEESPLGRPQAHTPIPLARRLPEGVQGASGKPPASMTRDNFAVSKFPWLGLTRRLRRGKRACSPKGRSIAAGGDPKGVQGGERKAPCIASLKDNFAVRNFPLRGLDAPTPARIGTGRPKGRSHFSFGGERKVCKRKPAARRLQRRPAPLRVIRKYRRSVHCRARPLYLLRPVSR